MFIHSSSSHSLSLQPQIENALSGASPTISGRGEGHVETGLGCTTFQARVSPPGLAPAPAPVLRPSVSRCTPFRQAGHICLYPQFRIVRPQKSGISLARVASGPSLIQCIRRQGGGGRHWTRGKGRDRHSTYLAVTRCGLFVSRTGCLFSPLGVEERVRTHCTALRMICPGLYAELGELFMSCRADPTGQGLAWAIIGGFCSRRWAGWVSL